MALIDLKTDLKSLKYGLDRRGMGSSKEPFITKAIPEGDTPGATLDYALRQGALSSAQDDKSRLTKLLLGGDPRGNKFISTTNLLSRNSVKTEATKGSAYAFGTVNQGVYAPTSTIAQTLAGIGGGHLNLLGINPAKPLAGVSDSGNLFEIGALNRYEDVVKANNTSDNSSANRLVSLYDNKIRGVTSTLNPLVSSDPNFILQYGGGPNSVLGVGKTRTKRATTTKTLKTAYKNSGGDDLAYNTNKTFDGETYGRQYKANPNFTRYRYGGISSEGDYADDRFNNQQTNTLNNTTELEGAAIGEEQLFKFYLQFISPPSDSTTTELISEYLYWQAYVDNFSDQIGAKYDSYNYVGRGYPLYKYDSFSRKIGLDFTIVGHTPDQLLSVYKKLNQLIQFMAPNYSNSGHIRGNFVKLTFGDYLNSVPGIIEGFSLSPIFEAGFDIGVGENTSEKQLPKAIKVSGFSFTPIADNNNSIISSNSTFINV